MNFRQEVISSIKELEKVFPGDKDIPQMLRLAKMLPNEPEEVIKKYEKKHSRKG
jgi:hypothetical protein